MAGWVSQASVLSSYDLTMVSIHQEDLSSNGDVAMESALSTSHPCLKEDVKMYQSISQQTLRVSQ